MTQCRNDVCGGADRSGGRVAPLRAAHVSASVSRCCASAPPAVQGIAKTGSGKTAAFVLPMIVHIMDQPELQASMWGCCNCAALPPREAAAFNPSNLGVLSAAQVPLLPITPRSSGLLLVQKGEGPIGVVVAPTRELAEQIHKETREPPVLLVSVSPACCLQHLCICLLLGVSSSICPATGRFCPWAHIALLFCHAPGSEQRAQSAVNLLCVSRLEPVGYSGAPWHPLNPFLSHYITPLRAGRFSKPYGLGVCAAFGGLSKHQQFKDLKAGCEVGGWHWKWVHYIAVGCGPGLRLSICCWLLLLGSNPHMQVAASQCTP